MNIKILKHSKLDNIMNSIQDRPSPPTPNSNYLLGNRILFGWAPSQPGSTGQYSNNIELLVQTNRDVFVNLMTSQETQTLYNYVPFVKSSKPDTVFLSYEIPDCGIPHDKSSFTQFILNLKDLFDEGKTFYIHCRGGHGRSGLVTACLLIAMSYSPSDALFEVKLSHLTREYIPDYPCPQTQEQVEFVKSFSL